MSMHRTGVNHKMYKDAPTYQITTQYIKEDSKGTDSGMVSVLEKKISKLELKKMSTKEPPTLNDLSIQES